MEKIEIFQLTCIAIFFFGGVSLLLASAKKMKELEERIAYQEKFNEARQKLYQKLLDSEKITHDFAASEVEVVETYYPRKTAPRSDAGPPAVIHKPVLRGVKSGSWNRNDPSRASRKKNPKI